MWSGELYLELHRASYTTQRRTKQGNRRNEHWLREAELWAATAAVRTGADYPYDELERIWQLVLLQQFHDILPGTSIAWVHREVEENNRELERELQGSSRQPSGSFDAGDGGEFVTNAGAVPRDGVPALSSAPRAGSAATQTVEPTARASCSTTAWSASSWTSRGLIVRSSISRPAARRSRRRRRQSAAAPPRPAQPVGRLGRRRALPARLTDETGSMPHGVAGRRTRSRSRSSARSARRR